MAPLTECNERSDDGHSQGSYEQVDGARQEGNLPHAGVAQSDDVSVGVMHLDVALNAGTGRERATDLRNTDGNTETISGNDQVGNWLDCFYHVLIGR